MATSSRLAIALGVVGLAASASASAAVTLFYEDFSTLKVGSQPAAGSYLTTTSFETGQSTYFAKGAPAGTPGNVDLVSGTYTEGGMGLCASAASTCLDLDGTGSGRKEDYVWTGRSFVLDNATDVYQLTVVADATSRGQQSAFHFGLLNPTNENYPLVYGGTPHSYLTVGTDEPIQSGFASYTYEFTLASLGLPGGTSARLFFENITNGANSDNVGAVIQSIQFTNVSAVPLPAAAWLLLSGLGGVGLFARRRRKEDSQAVAA